MTSVGYDSRPGKDVAIVADLGSRAKATPQSTDQPLKFFNVRCSGGASGAGLSSNGRPIVRGVHGRCNKLLAAYIGGPFKLQCPRCGSEVTHENCVSGF